MRRRLHRRMIRDSSQIIAPKPKVDTSNHNPHSKGSKPPPPPLQKRIKRVLYMVTSMHEYDTGQRSTQHGYDRFSNTLVPIVRESATSIMNQNLNDHYHNPSTTQATETAMTRVDVYLITHYRLSSDRIAQLRQALPLEIGLQVWDDATPLGYEKRHGSARDLRRVVQPREQALSRQHRFVIKDKFWHYDFFLHFEDDMLVRGPHVQHFCRVSLALEQLWQEAPPFATTTTTKEEDQNATVQRVARNFYGTMAQEQLRRVIPGFIRVEAVPAETPFNTTAAPPPFTSSTHDNQTARMPSTYLWQGRDNAHELIDPAICCHLSRKGASDKDNRLSTTTTTRTPPRAKDLHFWETSLDVLSIRKMPLPKTTVTPTSPSLDWVLLQAGTLNAEWGDPSMIIGEYWTGSDGHFGPAEKEGQIRARRTRGRYANNQGGWMGMTSQIFDWHANHCHDSFLPPFLTKEEEEDAFWKDDHSVNVDDDDTLDATVEFWSGGLQLVGANLRRACNLQRIVSLNPIQFSRHLLYHTSNNKQKSDSVRYRFSNESIVEFWGQLNTVRHNAKGAMRQELSQGMMDLPRHDD